MPDTFAKPKNGWALAIRQRRKALIQRMGVGAASALVLSPALGWVFGALWMAAYILVQVLEAMVFAPITTRKSETMGLFRSAVGCAVLFLNTAMYGGLSILLWLAGGVMGAVCAGVLLPATMVYSMINAPHSVRVLVSTLAPTVIYMALMPVFMTYHGAPQAFVIASGAACLIFFTFCVSTWQRMNYASRERAHALAEAERRRLQAERVVAGRSAFLAAVGHDLRTPIGAILTGAAELDGRDAATRASAELITDAGLMMKALLDDLLDHAKLDAGRMTVESTDFDLRRLVAQTLRLWKGPVEAKGLKLRVRGARRLPRLVRGDAMRVRQVLNNLISNALKFTPEGVITLNVRAWDDETGAHALVLEVSDTGPGMTRDQMRRLFTPFDQTADGISAQYGGSGLGLAISRELAQLMGGRLTARSAPGQGAHFTLSLLLPPAEDAAPALVEPEDDGRAAIARALSSRQVRLSETVAPPPAVAAPSPPVSETESLLASLGVLDLSPAPAQVPAQVPAVSARAAAPIPPRVEPRAGSAAEDPLAEPDAEHPLRVLVVDDHDINRRAIQLILQPLACEISMAADGLAALALCEGPPFDVIFMDVRMPELDGRETTRRLRAGGGPNAAAPVIAVTADTAPEDVAACTAAGMDYFVSKPLTPTALLGALAQTLAQAGESQAGESQASESEAGDSQAAKGAAA